MLLNFSYDFDWLKFSASIQAAADRDNTKLVYDAIKKAVGSTKKLTLPLQSFIGEIKPNRNEQLGRWVQHFSILYSKQNIVTDAAIKHMGNLPSMDDLDSKSTIDMSVFAVSTVRQWNVDPFNCAGGEKLTLSTSNASVVLSELGVNIRLVLRRTGLTTMYTTLSQRRLGHILRMSDERIPMALLNSELIVSKRNVGWPRLCYKYVFKRDFKSLNFNIDYWEKLTDDRNKWRTLISELCEREDIFTRPKKKTKEAEWIYFAIFYVILYF